MSLVVSALNVADDATRDRVWAAMAYRHGWDDFDTLTVPQKQARVDLQIAVYLDQATTTYESLVAEPEPTTTIVFS